MAGIKLITDSEKALLKQLKDPFDPKFVKWRVGATSQDKKSGIALAYIDSREVMKRLDLVCGISNWRKRLIPAVDGFICEIDIKIDGEWITRSDAAGNTNMAAIKGGASDAFKRAAANWGIGRYLYYLPNVWVAIKPQGKSFVLAETPALPDWARPNPDIENWEDVAELEIEKAGSSDEQEFADSLITNLDQVRAFKNTDDLEAFIATLDDKEQTALANEINIKRRELKHDSAVKAQ
jgi:hypothetical protein